MTTSLETLRDDFERIGLLHLPGSGGYDQLPRFSRRYHHHETVVRDELPTGSSPDDWDTMQVHTLLKASSRATAPSYEPGADLAADVVSDAANRLLAYARSEPRQPFHDYGVESCYFAEPKLLKHLSLDNHRSIVGDAVLLIATNERDEPAAVVKGIGAMLMYGLADDPKHGVMKGAWSVPLKPGSNSKRPLGRYYLTESTALAEPSAHSGSVYSAPLSTLGLVRPNRLAHFIINPDDLQQIQPRYDVDDNPALKHSYKVTHEAIQSRVELLLEEAVPLEEE